jgi:hypothetical protein
MNSSGINDSRFNSMSSPQQPGEDSSGHDTPSKRHAQQQEYGAVLYIFECSTCTRWFCSGDELLQHTKDSYRCATKILQHAALQDSSIAVKPDHGTREQQFDDSSASLQHEDDLPEHTVEPSNR